MSNDSNDFYYGLNLLKSTPEQSPLNAYIVDKMTLALSLLVTCTVTDCCKALWLDPEEQIINLAVRLPKTQLEANSNIEYRQRSCYDLGWEV